MLYSLSKVADIVAGNPKLSETHYEISNISIDSRRIITAHSTLFFAISGPRNNGHIYIAGLISKGVKCFVVEQIPANISTQGINYILVENTVTALQKLCAYHRNQFQYPVIGITGSNGKTIVKEWLYQLLSSRFRVVRNPKSYNSQVGVPLSVWQMDESFDLGIFEAGISKPGEMTSLELILKPTVGIFTNLGDAHSENFSTIQQKGREKLGLFKHSQVLIAQRGLPITDELLNEFIGVNPDITLVTWSASDTRADMFIKHQDSALQTITAVYKGIEFQYSIPFGDTASFENAAFCALTLLHLGYSPADMAEKISQLEPVEMRLQKMEGINNTVLINDTYNSDINSLEISVDLLTRQDNSRQRTIILTDILQTEKTPSQLYNMVNSILKAKQIDRFIGIGKDMEEYGHLIEIPNKSIYHTTDDFLQSFEVKSFRNETILLKGARDFGLEKVVKLLEKQSHQTFFEINLSAIESNFRYFKSLVHRETKIMAMVKAYSYGSGSFEVARLLEDAGTDYLAVAYTDEGIALREKGITKPIMVMNPDAKAFETMLDYDLEPEIYSFSLLKEFARVCDRAGRTEQGIHIELDTGMHRLGFYPEDTEQLEAELVKYPFIIVKSIFSHLAGSDEHRLEEFTLKQIQLFKKMAESLTRNWTAKPLLHILNSAGILHYKEGIFDMVRLGIGLHGIDPSDINRTELTVAGKLISYISQIKTIKAGDGVSYGLHSKSNKERTLGIIAIGYADGLDRKLGISHWYVLINGKKAYTVGNICMDMFMVDVTDIDCREGDEVLIFGKELPIETMAKCLGTIPYEILTSISPRVKRVYWYE